MNSTDPSLKKEFGRNSILYDEARPSYPPAVIDDVIRASGIADVGRILDIGCGPGRATILFGERGSKILGVDLSEELIAIARKKSGHLARVQYIVGEFETVNLPYDKYDLIVAAQALHWIDPDGGYRRIANLLTDQGTLAAFWNFENYEQESIALKVRALYLEHCPAFPADLGSAARHVEKLGASSLFTPPHLRTYYWNWELSKDHYVKLVKSWAWVTSLSERAAQAFMADLQDVIDNEPNELRVPFKTVLLMTTTKKEK